MYRTCLPFSLLCLLFVFVTGASAQDWTKLAPAGEGFSVQMPGKPQGQSTRVQISGDEYLSRMYTSEGLSPRGLYIAVMQEFPPVVANLQSSQRLDNFIDGFRKGFVKALTSNCPDVDVKLERELIVREHPARQYSFVCGGFPGTIRVIDNTQRMYVLLVMSTEQPEHSDQATKFLQSFELLPAPAPVPLAKG